MISTVERSADELADMKKYIVNVFEQCMKSVLPRNIIKNTLRYDSKTLRVNNDEFAVPKNVYVVGFGKAVLDMALEVERILDGSLAEAVVSVPLGAGRQLKNSKICVLEGAKNNMPDERAVENTERIKSLMTGLGDDDVLIALVSGGGSALLCSPTVPLRDKIRTIELLSSRGASIVQLNAVRRVLSHVKGGKLVDSANASATVVSLILSDVVGDRVSAIASGPTVVDYDDHDDDDGLPTDIIERFGLSDEIPRSVWNALRQNAPRRDGAAARGKTAVHNYVIGNNAIALRTGAECAKNDYTPVVLTGSLRGDVAVVSKFYGDLVRYACDVYANGARADGALREQLESDVRDVDPRIDVDSLTSAVIEASSRRRGLCVFGGGEPTVRVRGAGLGGRNQELALRTSVNVARDDDRRCSERFDIVFFSGGTDGIDGPTDACGAFGYPGLVEAARSRGLDASEYVENNDSYGFYSSFNGGEDLLKTGHTGTNVMDIHILLIRPK